MSRTLPTNFQTYNAIAQKNPRVIMSIDGIDDRTYSSGDYLYENETYVLDNFNDSDTTNLSSHSPDIGGSWTVESGSSEITSNEAEVTSSATFQAYQDDIGEDDSIITIKAYHSSAGGTRWTLGGMLRRDDINNHIIVSLYTSEGVDLFRIYEEFPYPPYSNIIYEDTPGSALQDDTEYTFVITLSGSSISVSVSGGGLNESEGGTLTNFTTGGEHGLYAFGDDDIFFTYFSITSGLSEQDPNNKKYIQSFEADFLNIDVKNGRSEQGQFRCRLIDKDLDVSEYLIVDNNLHEVDITYKLGYAEIAEDDFVSLETQRVRDIRFPNVTDVEIISDDVRRKISKEATLFSFASRKEVMPTGIAQSGESVVTMEDNSTYPDPANLPTVTAIGRFHLCIPAVIVGGREIIAYDAVNTGSPDSVDMYIRGVDPYKCSTPADAHEADQEVQQAILFNLGGNSNAKTGPMNALLSILLTRNTGSTTGHSYYDLCEYDTNFRGTGLGLTDSEVNVNSFEKMDTMLRFDLMNQGDEDLGRLAVGFKEVNALDWIADYCKSYGCFLHPDSSGKLAISNYDWIENHYHKEAVKTIDNDDIIEGSFRVGYDEILNHVKLSYGKNWVDNTYKFTKTFEMTNSRVNYGLTKEPFILETDAFDPGSDDPATDGISNAELIIFLRRIMWMFANPPGMFEIVVGIEHIDVTPGDKILLTADRFKDFTGSTTTQGWTTKKCLITGQRIVWAGGRPEIELRGFTWELMDKVDLEDSPVQYEYLVGDWDDSSIAVASASTATASNATQDARDAYIATSVTGAEIFRLEVTVTPPTSPDNADTEHLFDLALHAQNPSETDQWEANYYGVRYNTSEDAFNLVFYFTREGGTVTYSEINVEGYNCEQLDGTDAAANDLPTMTIVSLHTYDLNSGNAIAEITAS